MAELVPVARSLIVCDAVSSPPVGKVHLSGVFNAIRPAGFPHAGTRVVTFGQFTGGVGAVPAFIDVRHAARDEVVYHSNPLVLRFPDRVTVMQLSAALTRCVFPHPGLYTVELFCHNQFVCDTTIRLLQPAGANDH